MRIIHARVLVLLCILTSASALLIINNTPELKINLFKYFYGKYNNIFQYKLNKRFNDSDLQLAINHAKQQPWVNQQIAQDLAPFQNGINAEQVEAWFNGLQHDHKHNDLIKYKISAGKISVDPRSDISYTAAYQTINEVLQILAAKNLLADCEFIIALSDFLVYIPAAMGTDPIAVFSFAKHLEVPVEKNTILVPDWVNIRFAAELRGRIKFANKIYPWDRKKDILHWRGGNADSMQHRKKLVALAKKIDFLDVGMTIGDNTVKPVEPEFSIQNKYQIALDGARCTWSRILWQMQANTIMIKPDSPQVQWFYHGLQPYVNYLPIADIDEQSINAAFDWLQMHESQTSEIIRHANTFANDNFKTEDFVAYYALLLQEYAKIYKS